MIFSLKNIRYFIISIYCIPILPIKAQNPEWVNFVSHCYISDMIETDSCYWIATESDLIKWNFYTDEKIYYNKNNSILPPNEDINTLCQDAQGAIWIGTDSGLIRFGDSDWKIYTKDNSDLFHDPIYVLAKNPAGGLWVGANLGLYEVTQNGELIRSVFNEYLNHKSVFSIEIDKEGNTWLSDYYGRLYRIKGSTCISYDGEKKYPSLNAYSFSFDSNNTLWYADGWSAGLRSYDGHTINLYDTVNSPIPSHSITDIVCDYEDNIWVAMANNGVAKFDKSEWSIYDDTNSILPMDGIDNRLFVDKENRIWVGIEGSGLYSLIDGTWVKKVIDPGELPHYTVFCLNKDHNGNIWMLAPGKYLMTFQRGRWETIDLSKRGLLEGTYISSFAQDKNNQFWMGTNRHGLVHFDGEECTHYTKTNSPLPADRIYDIKVDSQDIKWMAYHERNNTGIARLEGDAWTVYNSENSSLPDQRINKIAIDRSNNKWFVVDAHNGDLYGLVKFDGVNWYVYNKANSGIPDVYISSLHVDAENTIWMGTYRGVFTFTGEACTYFGMADWYTRAITVGPNGDIWIGGREEGLATFRDESWTVYTSEADSLLSSRIYDLVFDTYDNLWIATGSGISVYKEGGVDSIFFDTEKEEPEIPNRFALFPNYPNPFNLRTMIEYHVHESTLVKLDIYNIRGQWQETITDGLHEPGIYYQEWDATGYSSGVYIYILHTANGDYTGKCLLLK